MLKKYLLLTLLFFGVGLSLYAEKITQYNIDITVEQSGELAIVESIEYDFEQARKHGMFRDIPFTIKHSGRIIDLGLYDFSVQMDDNVVEWQKSTMKSSHAGEIVRLKVGSASSYVTGKHHYRIAYRVKKGVLPAAQNSENDAIRWNIVGTGWQIPLYNITASFNLPASLSQQDLDISTYTGTYGSKVSNAKSLWKSPQRLEVKIDSLPAFEGATVELAYPAGLLDQGGSDNVKATFMDWFLANWHWGALAGFLLYFRTMYKRYTGFEDKRSIAVQYLPPKDLSLLQSGLILDKFADNEDFSAAILELGYLGYLTIRQKDKASNPVLKRTDKNTERLTVDQKYLLDSILFKESEFYIMSGGSESKANTLREGVTHINENLYKWSVSAGYMSENPQRVRYNFMKKSILWLLPVIAMVGYTLFSMFGKNAIVMLVLPLMFGMGGISIMETKKEWSGKLFGLLFIVSGFIPLFTIAHQEGFRLQTILVGPMGVLIIIIAAMGFVFYKIGKFTQKGAYASTQLLGLKEYVKRVKEDEIKRRLKMDPLYLERLLPYAVLFNEADHWLSFYDVLNVDTPYWYVGNVHNMGGFSNSVNAAATPPSTSSSGGGGFSGGGGGGGGGGSW